MVNVTPKGSTIILARVISGDLPRNRELLTDLADCGLRPEISPAHVFSAAPEEALTQFLHARIGRQASAAEWGCASAHRFAQQQLLESTSDWLGVFEDDAVVISKVGLRGLIELITSLPLDFGIVVLAYCGDAVVRPSRFSGLEECLFPPTGAVAYFLNRPAAKMLVEANTPLRSLSDWPVASDVKFFRPTNQSISFLAGLSTIGLPGPGGRPPMAKSWNLSEILARLTVYSGVAYLRNRDHFRNIQDYFSVVLRHRLIWHYARLLDRKNLRRPPKSV